MEHLIHKIREIPRLWLDLCQINHSRLSKRLDLIQMCPFTETSPRQKNCSIEAEVPIGLVKKVPLRLPSFGFYRYSSIRWVISKLLFLF